MNDRRFSNRARFFAAPIQLFDSPSTRRVVPEFKWIHCANEGTYRGHHQGEFELTADVFAAFVRNFRADPQFKVGNLPLDDGRSHQGGVHPVIQFDYEHASEMPAFEGSIAQTGAPAIAWVLDVEVRQGADGKTQLWAFAQLGEGIRKQIGSNEYRSVSIAFTLEGIHWITGEPIGPMLTSIAFTNHPFMRDLEPLAAANRGAGSPSDPAIQPANHPSEAPGGPSQPRTQGDQTMTELRERVCKALGIRVLQDDAAVAEAVGEAASGASDLRSLLEALGVSAADDALKAIPELRSARERLTSLLTELDSLLAQDTAMDQAMGEQDVGAAMSAQRYEGDGAKRALTAYRSQLLNEEIAKALEKHNGELRAQRRAPVSQPTLSQIREARAKGRQRFLAEYGITDPARAHLSRTVVAGPNGAQFSAPEAPSSTALPISERSDATTIDLRGQPGRNTTEKLISHLSSKDPEFAKLPLEAQVTKAAVIRRTSQITLN